VVFRQIPILALFLSGFIAFAQDSATLTVTVVDPSNAVVPRAKVTLTASQRGSLLCYDFITKFYEIGQYTPACLKWWQGWLKNNYHSIEAVNTRYNTHFKSFSSIPMPKSELDTRFGDPKPAYRDLVSSINDWVVTQYRQCRSIWHKYSKQPTPFILQLSGYLPEKFALGRPSFAMLDIYSWMQTADALGLSLYTNALYADWGHDSDKAMVNSMYLGVMQNKSIFVMEGGNENDGAVLLSEELIYFSDTARILKPKSYIYEFIKTPFYICFKHREGYILDCSGKINNTALAAVKAALENAKTEATMAGEIYVYDDPQSLSEAIEELLLDPARARALDHPHRLPGERRRPGKVGESRLGWLGRGGQGQDREEAQTGGEVASCAGGHARRPDALPALSPATR